MAQEHDDDLDPSIEDRAEGEMEDFPATADEIDDEAPDDELDDDDIIGK